MPPAGKDFDERLALFQANAKDLRASFELLAGPAELADRLAAIAKEEGWKKVAYHEGELTTPACQGLALGLLRTDQPYEAKELETCDAGVSQCEALVAQTGSVVVSAKGNGGRAISVLPPHHVVLARRDQLVGDLGEAISLVKARYAGGFPSMISFITGPSRTGDIERILVLGAHGPKKLTIFCV